MTIPSLAERATISAQETFRGHSSSSAALIVWTYLKFLIPKLLSDVFSDVIPFTVSNKRDASHDYTYIRCRKTFVNDFHSFVISYVRTCYFEMTIFTYLNHTIMEEIPNP